MASCLASLDGEADQVVVIDDGSTDGTWSRIQEWARGRTDTVVLTQSNVGVSRTLNRALALATGDYVIPCASDDMLLPGSTALRVDAIGDAEALYSDVLTIDDSGAETGIRRHDSDFIRHWSIAGPMGTFRRSALVELGGWSEHLLVEDWDLALRLGARGRVVHSTDLVAAYREHAGGASANSATARARQREAARVAWSASRLYRGADRLALMVGSVWLSVRR